jgi:hypothetical protein
VQIHGEAWWAKAGDLPRDERTRVGDVIAFAKLQRRVLMVTHANSSRLENGGRSRVDRNATWFEDPRDNGWSRVRVRFSGSQGRSGTIDSLHGLLYGCYAASELTAGQPDPVDSMLVAYGLAQ